MAEAMSSYPPWAKSPIGDDPHVTIAALQSGLAVNLIATDRAKFETCRLDEAITEVVQRNRSKALDFDFLPVIGKQHDRIVGLLEVAPYMRGEAPLTLVSVSMQPLSEENLIGADASILAFVRDADHHRCRLIISGNAISGLISLSDLQRLPVRAALFGLVTYLEIIMADLIRQIFDGSDRWLELLTEGRRGRIQNEIERARAKDGLVEALLFTQFADKRTIIGQFSNVRFDRKEFEGAFKRIEDLRNRLAHANDYAASPDAAIETCKTVRLIDKWSSELLSTMRNTQGITVQSA